MGRVRKWLKITLTLENVLEIQLKLMNLRKIALFGNKKCSVQYLDDKLAKIKTWKSNDT